MLLHEIIEKGYVRESQTYTENELTKVYTHGIFDWKHYTILINDVIQEKITARDDNCAINAVNDLYNVNIGDYIKIVEVIVKYRTAYELYKSV